MTELRPARFEDCERVYAWSCAPDVRAVSRDPRPVAYDDHRRWFANRLLAGAPTWIVEHAGESVGVVRIDDDRISIALAASARGRGIGKRAIALAARAWQRPIVAEIAATNHASRACFEACGFVALGGGAFLTYQWRP